MSIDWGGSFVEAGDLDISYVRSGQGLPVVFLHGWPEFNRTWLHNLPALAANFDVIAPDLRGFGRTRSKLPRQAGGTPPLLLARDLAAFADALNIVRFAIVAHDVGSFVAQAFALAHPDRVRALFFFNCAYPGIGQRWGAAGNFPELWYQQFHQKDFAAELIGSSREATRIYLRHFLTHWAHQKAAFDDYFEEWVDNFLRPGNLQGGFDWYVGVAEFRSRMMREETHRIPRVDTPSYFLWGRHDPVLKFAWSDRLADYFTQSTLECAESAGHFVHFEVPELANRRIASFLGRYADS